MAQINGDCKPGGQTGQLPCCIPEDGFRPQARHLCVQGNGNFTQHQTSEGCRSKMPPGPPGCAAERLLQPNNHYVCDQKQVLRQQHLVKKYAGGASCNPCRPGYNPDCAVPLWSHNKQGFRGAVPYTGPYDKEAPYHYAESPYYMDNDDPRKFFMSGYTGFVPNTQSVIGNVFPLTTNKGLRKFTDLQCNVKQNFCKPVIVSTKDRNFVPPVEQLQQCSKDPLRTIQIPDVGIEYDPTILLDCTSSSGAGFGLSSGSGSGNVSSSCCGSKGDFADSGGQAALGHNQEGARRKMKMFRRKDPHPIYRVEEGLLPTYGGHVPNQQFRFGGTFGRETLNARNLSKRRG
ncbi:protein FAM166B-like [Pollicipes pollicipes]|uniref:protein FAM166B-like n=1 Tax=Pollicipes pollicipes TaxID=41117 RepID=UPI001885A2D3|nr:protein FAM166B-like [Pollicipes pollicipes]